MAMKGRHWIHEENAPDPTLKGFLTKKANSVKKRILEATGVTVLPIYYCAGYTEDDGTQLKPFNLSKLLYYILMAVPTEKRLILAENLNEDEFNWEIDDGEMDYGEAIRESFWDSLKKSIGYLAEKGAVVGGTAFGLPGIIVGGLIGTILGGLHGLIVKPIIKAVA
jgi:hypothetical protein